MSLTAAREAKRQDGNIVTYPVKEDQSIYKGQFVCTLTSDGFARAGADTLNYKLLGVAVEDSTGADDADGVRHVRVDRTGVYEFNMETDLGQDCVGTNVYVEDAETIEKKATTSNDVLAGVVVEYIDTSTVRIAIDYATQYSATDAA